MVSWGEIEQRLDPNYFSPGFRRLMAKISGKPHFLLRELCSLSSEMWDQKSLFIGAFPYLEISEIDIPTGEIKSIANVPIEEAASRARMIVREGDLLVSTTRPRRGAITLVTAGQQTPFIASTGFVVIRKISSNIHRDYLYAVMRSQVSLQQMQQRSSGGNYPAITPSELKRLRIPVPERGVQERVMQLHFAALDQHKLNMTKADALLASIDDYLLSELGIVLPPEPESTITNRMFRVSMRELQQRHDPNFFGRKYVYLTEAITAHPFKLLRDLCGFSSEAWDQKSGYNETFPYLEISAIDLKTGNVTEISETPIAEAPSRAKMVARSKDILVSTTRPSRGAITIVPSDHAPFIASTGLAVIRTVNSELIDRDYLYCVLRSKLGIAQMEQRSSGGNYPAITPTELKRIEIPVPKMATQLKIVAEVGKRKAAALAMRSEANAELEKAKREIETILLGAPA